MSDESERRSTAREEFEQARERYFRMREQERELRQQERELRHKAREQEREARRMDRDRARDERRSLRDEIRRTIHGSMGGDLGSHIGRTIRDSMNFSFDMGDLGDVGGEEYSEVVERDFTVGGMPRLQVRNISGDTRITVGAAGAIHVKARKRVRGTSEERAKRLLENVEVRMEQDGDDVMLKPHLYEQDRGWADLFRGGRVAVDFEITVPREVRLEAQTVSGDLVAAGTRGPIDAQSVSGDVRLEDVQGPLRLKTVSGDATVEGFAGQLVGNTVSGDLTFDRVRLHGSDIVTVSGEVRIEGELDKAREHRMKTISGDVDLRLTGGSYDIRFKSMSGDLDSEIGGTVDSVGRRDKHVVIGAAETKVSVKTMSGDLEIRASGGAVPESSPHAEADQPDDVERTEPMEPPVPPTPPVPPRADVRELLERVARGELDVDAAAAALDATRGA
ncbi:MAG TPA: DUF4097 family beta strand repeat-containing protein [Candidatus Limnocylindria bacterium]|nr:DUF4097 family beta strand repeat-containing protein [Candidatus Limnocylindria bacterium]